MRLVPSLLAVGLWAHLLIVPAISALAADAPPGPIEFQRSEVRFPSHSLRFADFNGDGLEDILSFGRHGVRIFIQDPQKGFTGEGSVGLSPLDSPSVIWPARLDGHGPACLLELDPQGMRALRLAADRGAFVGERLIEQSTILPGSSVPRIMFMETVIVPPLALETDGGRPLLLLPTRKGLEVWRHEASQGKWVRAGVLSQVPQTAATVGWPQAGYTLERFLNIAVADVNRDGCDDLVVRRLTRDPGRICLDVHIQTAEGMLPEEPSQRIERAIDENGWLSVYDLNRDGRLDLLETSATDTPIMLPGTTAGRVVVRPFLAGPDGRWPAEPAVTLRKRDWQKRLPMVDLDGDGCIDLVVGHLQWSSRDDLVRAMEAQRIRFDLRFHFWENSRAYSETPDGAASLTVYTGIMGSNADQIASLARLDGDFNGDGRQDLLVRSDAHDLAIHHFRSRRQPYAGQPDRVLALDTSNPAELLVRDLNGDGISDIVVLVWWDDEPARVYLSRRQP